MSECASSPSRAGGVNLCRDPSGCGTKPALSSIPACGSTRGRRRASTADVNRIRLGLERAYEAAPDGDVVGAHGSGRVEAKFGYGLPLAGGGVALWAGVGLEESERGYRLGYAFHAAGASSWWPPAASSPAPRPSTPSPSSRR